MLYPGSKLLLGGIQVCVDSVGHVFRDGTDVDVLGVLARPDIVVASNVVDPTSNVVAVVPDVANWTVDVGVSAGVRVALAVATESEFHGDDVAAFVIDHVGASSVVVFDAAAKCPILLHLVRGAISSLPYNPTPIVR